MLFKEILRFYDKSSSWGSLKDFDEWVMWQSPWFKKKPSVVSFLYKYDNILNDFQILSMRGQDITSKINKIQDNCI